MRVEMTRDEVTQLIAVLVAAENALTGPIALALDDLRDFRNALFQVWLREEMATRPAQAPESV